MRNKKDESDDYDSPWKEIIEQYFKEFIEFFFPEAFDDINWDKGYEFLDKELQQITKDADEVRRYVDKLVRVWLIKGDEAWALIHTDIQAQQEKNFSERMYIYNYRIYDKFRRHIVSFAVLGDKGSKWKPDTFERNMWGCEIRFKFPVIKLSDYRKKSDELGHSKNPFAIVVLAHLKTQETAKNKNRRRIEKLALIRQLYHRGFSKQDIINLFRFIDWLMDLPEKEDKLFWQSLKSYEEEEKMPYITSVERIGYEKGYEIGEKRGEKKGEKRGEKRGYKKGIAFIVAGLIAKKFNTEEKSEVTWLAGLDEDDLRELGKLVLDFKSLEEVHGWIDERTISKNKAL